MVRRHGRAGGRVLHDRVHAHHAYRVQPEPAEGVRGGPAARLRDVRRADRQDRRQKSGRGGGPAGGGQHDAVADVRAKRAAVCARAAGGRVERSRAQTCAVHAVAALW